MFCVLLFMGVLKKECSENCSKFTEEHPCRSVISLNVQALFLKSHFGMGVLL